MRVLTAALAVALLSVPLQAQDVTLGDQVRVRANSDSAWAEGRLMAKSDSTLSVAHGTERARYKIAQVQADHWQPKNPAVTLLTFTAAGALGWWAGGKLSDDDGFESPWITGSEAGDVALGGGTGLVLGLGVWALDQGDWNEWIR